MSVDTSLLYPLLLVIHVGGAIVGLGPSFTFALLGPMAGRVGPQGGIALLEAMVAIERKFILPVVVVTQPLSGIALIFVAGYDRDFFSHAWLWVSILIYAVVFYLGIFVQIPRTERMLKLAKAGPPTPEFTALAKSTQQLGPIFTLALVTIIIFMIAKPGA